MGIMNFIEKLKAHFIFLSSIFSAYLYYIFIYLDPDIKYSDYVFPDKKLYTIVVFYIIVIFFTLTDFSELKKFKSYILINCIFNLIINFTMYKGIFFNSFFLFYIIIIPFNFLFLKKYFFLKKRKLNSLLQNILYFILKFYNIWISLTFFLYIFIREFAIFITGYFIIFLFKSEYDSIMFITLSTLSLFPLFLYKMYIFKENPGDYKWKWRYIFYFLLFIPQRLKNNIYKIFLKINFLIKKKNS